MKAGLSRTAWLLIVGDGPQEGALRADAERRGIADRCIFAGYRRDVLELMSLADLIVHPSLSESFGQVIVEAMAQAGGLLTQLSLQHDGGGDKQEKLFYLVKVDNARFSKMVVPGDQLFLEVRLKRQIRNMAQYESVARVDGKEVASAEILCAEGRS